jgi:chromosomal replication initiation ATPase DnaA
VPFCDDGVRIEGRKMQPDILANLQPVSHEQSTSCFLDALRAKIGEHNFQHWFVNRSQVSLEGSTFVVSVGSTFLSTWMQRRFSSDSLAVARAILPGCNVDWVVNENLETDTESDQSSKSGSPVASSAITAEHSQQIATTSAAKLSPRRGKAQRGETRREGR